MRTRLALLVSIIVLSLCACELSEEREPLSGPWLVADAESVTLRPVEGESFYEAVVTLRNEGSLELVLTDIRIVSSGSGFVVGMPLDELPTLFSNESLDVPVRWSADSINAAPMPNWLEVTSNGGTIEVGLTVEGFEHVPHGCEVVSSSEFDFGDVREGLPEVVAFALQGCEDRPVNVRVSRFEPPDAPFEVYDYGFSRFSFEPGQWIRLELAFHGREVGVHEAVMVVESDVPGQREVRVPLRGRVVSVDSCIDVRAQCRTGPSGRWAEGLTADVGAIVECRAVSALDREEVVSGLRWELEERPEGSHAELGPTAVEASSVILEVDEPGIFRLRVDAPPERLADICRPAIADIEAE